MGQYIALGRLSHLQNVTTFNSHTLSSVGSEIATSAFASRSGTIDRIQVFCSSVVGSGAVYEARLEGVTNMYWSYGMFPSRSLLSAGSSGLFTPTVPGVITVNLATPVTITEGTAFGLRVTTSSGVGVSNHAVFQSPDIRFNASGQNWLGQLMTGTGSGNFGSSIIHANIAALFSTGQVNFDTYCCSAGTSTGSGTPNKYGAMWVQPFTADLIGAFGHLGSSGGSRTYVAEVLDPSAVLSSTTFNQGAATTNNLQGATDSAWYPMPRTTLVAGSTYRLVFRATQNSFGYKSSTFPSVEHVTAFCGFPCYQTTFDGTVWLDETNKFPHLLPVFDLASLSASGGSPASFNPFRGRVFT